MVRLGTLGYISSCAISGLVRPRPTLPDYTFQFLRYLSTKYVVETIVAIGINNIYHSHLKPNKQKVLLTCVAMILSYSESFGL